MNTVHTATQQHSQTLQELLQQAGSRALTLEGERFTEYAVAQCGGNQRPKLEDLPFVTFRYVQPDGVLRFDLRHDSLVDIGEQTCPLHCLLETQWPFDHAALARAVWNCQCSEALIQLLEAMQVVVRFGVDLDGVVQGHAVSAAFCIALIRKLQAGQGVLPNGDPITDALTRCLGIRNRVVQLMLHQRREPVDTQSQSVTKTIRWLRGR